MTSWGHKYDGRATKEGRAPGISTISTLKYTNSLVLLARLPFLRPRTKMNDTSQRNISFCMANCSLLWNLWRGHSPPTIPASKDTHTESVQSKTRNYMSKIHSHTWLQYWHFRHFSFFSVWLVRRNTRGNIETQGFHREIVSRNFLKDKENFSNTLRLWIHKKNAKFYFVKITIERPFTVFIFYIKV